ncbi:MAG: RluA family pseudouridine synthase [Clostridia bacterium]|nr:RluA family pseudouridine synthase [Clostridia bacterium]
MKRTLEYTIDYKYDGIKLKIFLKEHCNMSDNLIKALKREYDGIFVNGRHERVTYVLKRGDMLRLTMYEGTSENIVPANIPIDIIYEDEDIAVVNKQANMPTHPSLGNYENTLANAMMYHWQSKGKQYVFRAVNRLDKDTSGIMVIAKNAYSHAQLCTQIQDGRLRRKYRAIVCGNLETDGTVDAPIKRREESIIERCVAEDGQEAVTHYKIIRKYDGYTLIELELETGRTHQIRVHMSYLGHPIAGDWLYGNENHDLIPRQALHSVWAEFFHPVTGEKMSFYRDIPEDMMKLLESLN